MKNTAILFVALVMSIASQAQNPTKWNIDQSHASVNFSINHFFSAVDGKFRSFDGDFYFNPDDPINAQFNFTVDIASVDTDEPDRDKHLQSADFFNTEKWPTMKFVSTKVVKKGKDNYVVYGNLTIRDVTKKVELPLRVTGMIENPWNKEKIILGIQIKTAIDRTDYGVGTGSWAATAVVGDEVNIAINMELDGEKPSN